MLSAKEIVESRKMTPVLTAPITKEFEPSNTSEGNHEIQNSLLELQKNLATDRIKKLGTLSKAEWNKKYNLAEVIHQVGSHWNKMGRRINNKLYIYPEEALYLLENGSIEIFYNGVPMSIQRAYCILLSPSSNVSLESYRVYSYLNSMGYKVVKHSDNCHTPLHKNLTGDQDKPEVKRRKLEDLSDQCSSATDQDDQLKIEENLIQSSQDDVDVEEVFRRLKCIKCFDDFSDSTLSFNYDIYIPSKVKTNKNSLNGLPDNRVIIHRGCEAMPSLADLAKLTKKYNDDVPVVNAIVFPDHIAFYQISPVDLPCAADL